MIKVPVTLTISFPVYEALELAAKLSGQTISAFVSETVRREMVSLKHGDCDLFKDWIKDLLKDEDWNTEPDNKEEMVK